MSIQQDRPLAVVTGASSGIGLELARQCIGHGFDVFLVADEPKVEEAAAGLRTDVIRAYGHQANLRTAEGVEEVCRAIEGLEQPVEALLLNAGVGVAGDFARETNLDDELGIIALNCSSVVHLAKRLIPKMIAHGRGRVLLTSSVVANMPAALMAVYGASKAFGLAFAEALHEELRGTGVTVTAVQPGPTATEFFRRNAMQDRKVAQQKKDDPAQVARQAFEAMMRGDDKSYTGSVKTRLLGRISELLPEPIKARQHRKLAERDRQHV